jgi:trimethylamine---corrinoid protein Co-methyltransferase
MIYNFATLLSDEQVERVHEASLEILEQVGMLVRNKRAVEIFSEHGAQVDKDRQIVRLPRKVVGGIPGDVPAHIHLLRTRSEIRPNDPG